MANTAEIIRIGQLEVRFLLDGGDTDSQLAMFEFMVPAGARVPLPHSHSHYDETVYGLQGTITFTVGGKIVPIHPGETCYIPRGVVHGFTNQSSGPCKALAVVTPAEIGPEFFRDCAGVINTGRPPDLEKMRSIFKQYGIVPLPPTTPAL